MNNKTEKFLIPLWSSDPLQELRATQKEPTPHFGNPCLIISPSQSLQSQRIKGIIEETSANSLLPYFLCPPAGEPPLQESPPPFSTCGVSDI